MAFIGTAIVVTPGGLWINLINTFQSFAINYALAIILLTICVKLILSPLDFFNRKFSRDSARMQAVIGPEMQKLQKQYGHDRNLLNQKTSELYKKNGFNMGGSCIIMLVYLIVTLVVFFTLFSALNGSMGYRMESQYLSLKESYYTAYTETAGDEDAKKAAGQEAVLKAYDSRDSQFLWVKNVWFPDNPWTNSVPTFEAYVNTAGGLFNNNGSLHNIVNIKSVNGIENLSDFETKYSISTTDVNYIITDGSGEISINLTKLKEVDETTYNAFYADIETTYNDVMGVIRTERGGPNGYLITALIAISSALLMQWLMQRKTKIKNQNNGAQAPGNGKLMLVIMPIIMGIFTLFFNALFGMYIIATQLVSLVTTPLIDKLLDKYYDKKQRERDEKMKVEYSRK